MRHIIYILLLTLLQAFLFGRIHLFGVATPLVYVYYVLSMPRNVSHAVSMPLAFLLGLLVDIFANTPGLASASMTLVAFLQPYILKLFLKKEDSENYRPSMAEMGFRRYFTYAMMILVIYCFAFFTLEAFSFVHLYEWMLSIVGSIVLTTLLILVYESIRR